MPSTEPSANDSVTGQGIGLLARIYYLLKPILPRKMRYSMRRLRAHYKLRSTENWPIMESAGRKPPDWKGWPDGKQFGVILTHDVEGQIGVDRTPSLAALEKRQGFRSSYNFIPEGEYRVSAALRHELEADGFEVGVHDLHHDGSLYRSRKAFDAASIKINRHLREWGAVGFRAGFMFHNLEWLKSLEIEYDASTFDVDPFEPQSDGVGTIFPFWVPGHRTGTGYVELPYTLPQDSTLFLIFRYRTNNLWKRKLDWVAAHGGMVLLNVHPDYLAFGESVSGESEFPAAFYEEFLAYVRERYAGAYWHGLPRDIARHIRSQQV